MLAARDIVDAVKMSWIRQWWEFAGGALVLLGTKMREKAEILTFLCMSWEEETSLSTL